MSNVGPKKTITLLTLATTLLAGTTSVALAASPAQAASCVTTNTCTVSSAPRALTAKMVPGGLTFTWAAPLTSGGLAVSSYDVHVTGPNGYDNTLSTAAVTRTVTVTDLEPNTAYTVTVTALNGVGVSAPVTSEFVTASAPSAVRSLRSTMLPNGITTLWSAPASTGGLAVSGYDVHVTGPDNFETTTHTDAATRTATFTGLASGSTYNVSVTASNPAGSSPVASIDAATPTAPDQVRSIRAVMSTVGQANVTWSAPASNGGLAVTGYTATISPAPSNGAPATVTTAASTRSALFTGLDISTDYTITVTASSAAGVSAPAALLAHSPDPSSPVRSLRATTDPGSVKLTWSAPAATGGTAITGYEVVQTDAAGNVSGVVTAAAVRTVTFTELGNGNTYTYNVRAINAAGFSSAATVVATTPVPPPAVRSLRATVAVATSKVTVNWSAPASNGGETITGYRATISPATNGDVTVLDLPASARSAVFTDLGGHANYTITVHAVNSVGHGVDEHIVISFPAPPSEPQNVNTISNAAGSATVNWDAPEEQGSTPVSSYRVTYVNDGGVPVVATVGSDVRTFTANDLTPGGSYTFSVVAVNTIGVSTAGQATIVIPTVSEPVVNLVGVGADQNVTLTWDVPGNDGGAPLTGYRVHVTGPDAPADVTVSSPTAVVSGLTNGVSYSFSVTALNVAGESAVSSVAATPYTVADAPVDVVSVGGLGGVNVSWSAPVFDGGTPLMGYRVVMVDSGSGTVLVDELVDSQTLSKALTGLGAGTTVVTTVNAVNAAGVSVPGQAVATSFAVAGAVSNIAAVSGNSTVNVTWEAPVTDGGAAVSGYELTAVAGADVRTVSVNSDVYAHLFTGLDGTKSYTFTVVAVNAVGNGPGTDISSTPAVAPAAVVDLNAEVTRSSVALSWTVPDSDGGAPITGYDVSWVYNGVTQTATTAGTTYTIGDTPPGAEYVVTVKAVNAVGSSTGAVVTATTLNALPGVTGIAGAPYAYNNPAPANENVDQANGVAVDSAGNTYVSRLYGISKIAPNGTVTNFSNAGIYGGPMVIVNDSDLYVTATGGTCSIYKISLATGVSTRVVGANNSCGYVDGPYGTSRIGNTVWGIAADADGNVYFTDKNRIRKLAADGTVSTFAGQDVSGNVDGVGTAALFNNPTGISYDSTTGILYVADTNNNKIRKIAADGTVTSVAGSIGGYTVLADGNGHLYTTPSFNTISRYNTDGSGAVSVLSSSSDSSFADGPVNGRGASVSTEGHGIWQLTATASGDLIVPDSGNNAVRKISNGMMSTIAGRQSTSGYVDATGDNARFNNVQEAFTAPDGTVYVSDKNGTIRKITPEGVVTTFVGNTASAMTTSADGTGTGASFFRNNGVTMDPAGNLYVAETDAYKIRKVTPAGVVSTLVTSPGVYYSKLVYAPDNNLYAVAGNVVKKVTLTGTVSNVATISGAMLRDIAYNPADGSLMVADSSNAKLWKVSTAGTVTSYKDGLTNVFDVTVADDGTAYIAVNNPSAGTHGIRRVATDGTVSNVTDPNNAGKTNGALATATFGRQGLGLQIVGDVIYVADREGKVIRKVQL